VLPWFLKICKFDEICHCCNFTFVAAFLELKEKGAELEKTLVETQKEIVDVQNEKRTFMVRCFAPLNKTCWLFTIHMKRPSG
jgi:hypothetical protein